MQVTVVIPVYADWDSLKECIESLKQHLDRKHKVILVNDCGPEAELLEDKIKKTTADLSNFNYYRNSTNLGFLRTCNHAVFGLDNTNNDILLLNSDTKVTAGFLEEMLDLLNAGKTTAAVSPRSNNATICTVPLSAMSKKGIEPKKSYEAFLKLKEKIPRYNEVPTAHGFCMLIKRDVIKKYGLFDEIFGKGYGEENDFCMRVKQHGHISILANRAYVFHLEARSFTIGRKQSLLEQNAKILRERWPEYKKLVSEYIAEALVREEGSRFRRKLKIIGYRLNVG